ncbi:MAG: glycoside hydrolase TIM-barrel-like domain-containing protein, partial [Pseudomonadota bacterium]
REAAPTEWTPGSKPIWFTEIGCPAVDLGANQPNVFVDPKSSETALPYFSRGVRDDYMQQRYLQASLTHWESAENNPVSPLYPGRMIDLDRAFVWTWDVRPWPDFPSRTNVWSDGPNHRLGHWISGRLGAAPLADVVAEICRECGVEAFDVSALNGVVQGYLQDEQRTGRAALQTLMTVYAFDAVESGDVVKFRHRARTPDGVLSEDETLLSDVGGAELQLIRASEGDLPRAVRLTFIDSEREYESSAVEATAADATSTRVEGTNASVLLDSGTAQDVADRYLAEARAGRESAEVVCARRVLAVEPGDVVELATDLGGRRYRIERIDDDASRAAVLTRVELGAYASAPRRVDPAPPPPAYPAAPLEHQFMDLPLIEGSETGPTIAAFAAPWSGTASLFVGDDGESFDRVARLVRPATMGVLLSDLPGARPHLWTRGSALEVQLFGGGLSAQTDQSVLNGANRAAVLSPSGEWEVIQFRNATLIGPEAYRLDRLLRGQAGTEPFIGDPTPEGAPFVLLDRAVEDVAVPEALRGVERFWRIGPSSKPFTHDSYRGFVAADRAVRLRPYAPAHLKAALDPETGDLTIAWIRRSRRGGDPWEGAAPPLSETREAYVLRLGSVRTLEVSEPRFVYDTASQAADGVAGELEIAVSQISDEFGPGPETKVTVNV